MLKRYSIYIPKSQQKAFRKIPSPWQERIKRAIDSLEIDPFLGEKMWGKYKDYRKLRIWPYRVIYYIDEQKKIIKIVELGHRGGVGYK